FFPAEDGIRGGHVTGVQTCALPMPRPGRGCRPALPLWGVPAGTLAPGEDPETCARRELGEEAGVSATELVRLTSIWTTPGFTDEVIHLYLATGLTAGTPARERDEFIEVEPHPLSRVLTRIRDGEIRDAKTI